MKLRELKEWIDEKDDDELDEEVIISDRYFPKSKKDMYEITGAGMYLSDEYKGYVIVVTDKLTLHISRKLDYYRKKALKLFDGDESEYGEGVDEDESSYDKID